MKTWQTKYTNAGESFKGQNLENIIHKIEGANLGKRRIGKREEKQNKIMI